MLGFLTAGARKIFATPYVKYLLLAATIVLILTFQLASRPAGLSDTEAAAGSASQDINAILDDPVNAPYKLLQYVLGLTAAGDIFPLRLASIAFGIVGLLCFYWLCRVWFGKAIGLMGAAVIAGTPLFLILARHGSPAVMYFSVIPLMAVYIWNQRTDSHKDLAFLLLMVSAALALYTPGLVWWLIGAAIIAHSRLKEIFSAASQRAVVSGSFLAVLLLVPLTIGLTRNVGSLKELALIPAQIPYMHDLIINIGRMLAGLFVKAPSDQEWLINGVSILSFAQLALLAFGTYAMWTAAKGKFLALSGAIILSVILASLNSDASILALGLPALLILVVAGLRFLYIEWRTVFPHNPVAKSLALALMCGVVIVQLLYGLRYGLVAWPQTPSTKTVYVLK